jgi:hypothetical protein
MDFFVIWLLVGGGQNMNTDTKMMEQVHPRASD